MSQEILERGIEEILAAVEDCLTKKRFLPALILLYSTIDIVSGLDRPPAKKTPTRDDFRAWVDAFLLPSSGLQCSSLDLYAARCGIIHTYSSESALSESGAAHQVFYAWGTSKADDLDLAIQRTSWKGKAVTVHVDRLVTAYKRGLQQFLLVLAADPARAARVYSRAAKFFSAVPVDLVQIFLGATPRPPKTSPP
jgi:hypothetical protein